MKGVIVTGNLALIDAPLVRFLRRLKQQYGAVWAAPTIAQLAPAVSLGDLRYIFGQLASIDGVVHSVEDAPPGFAITPFPDDFIEPAQALSHRSSPLVEATPATCTVDDLLKQRPDPLVLLTGCFDLIHAGHLRLIEKAAAYGAAPVVAALTSRAIRAQPKNQQRNRPLWARDDRATVLAELRCKPNVLFFDGPDALALIERLQPDVWVKALRDRGRPIVEQEARLVEQLGGRVIWLDTAGYGSSSTEIEQAISAPARTLETSTTG